jgi:quinol monooxygenase YgiN
MIIAILRMVVRPEKRKEVEQIVRGILESTRVQKGCLNYGFYQDLEDENTFTVLERWATQADLEEFIRSESYRQLLAAMELLAEPPEVMINAISYTAGLEAIKAARQCSDTL